MIPEAQKQQMAEAVAKIRETMAAAAKAAGLDPAEVRHCAAWNTPDILAVYAGSDELVARKDTEEFLRLNPEMQRLCIEGSGHRMNQKPEYLSARRHPVHRNVEETAKLPHREKEIRRQKDDEQASPKPGMPATVL